MTDELVEEGAIAMHPYVSTHKDWPEWDRCADWYKENIRRQVRAVIPLIEGSLLRDAIEWSEATTANAVVPTYLRMYARERGLEIK